MFSVISIPDLRAQAMAFPKIDSDSKLQLHKDSTSWHAQNLQLADWKMLSHQSEPVKSGERDQLLKYADTSVRSQGSQKYQVDTISRKETNL